MEESPRDRARRKNLWNNFRITPEEWQKIDEYQNGVCFICQKRQKSGKRLATDHCHKTGLVRGLLCSQCNRLLGRIESAGFSIEWVKRMIEYWLNPPAERALGKQIIGYAGRVGTKKHRKELRQASQLLSMLGETQRSQNK